MRTKPCYLYQWHHGVSSLPEDLLRPIRTSQNFWHSKAYLERFPHSNSNKNLRQKIQRQNQKTSKKTIEPPSNRPQQPTPPTPQSSCGSRRLQEILQLLVGAVAAVLRWILQRLQLTKGAKSAKGRSCWAEFVQLRFSRLRSLKFGLSWVIV